MIKSMILSMTTWGMLILIILLFGVIALIAFILKKTLKLSNEKKPSDEEIANENLNNLLEDVEDEETIKQFENFEKDTDKK